MEFSYDVVVIGAGHAGCEAAAAAANLGAKVCLITMDMNKVAQMSCNPAVGGIAKGQIVREIDALGGYMGLVTDRTAIQFRMLNRSKGPAMWSPRAQCDRGKFIWAWREVLDGIPNLHIWQDTVTELLVKDGEAMGVKTQLDVTFHAKAVVLTAGTFLNGLMHFGRVKLPGGRVSEPASLLPSITFEAPRCCIGTNTNDCMKSGAVFGTASAIDGMIDRFEAELGEKAALVATGHLARRIIPYCQHDLELDDDLTMKGLAMIWERNKKARKK